MKKLTLILLALLTAAPSLAAAQTIDAPPIIPKRSDTRVRFWSVDTGLRNMWIKDGAYDPYSTNDALTQWSLGMSRTTYIHNQWSFAPGLRWDFGSTSATARGAETNVVAHRLTVPLELRMHVERWFYVFTRAAPGAVWQRSRVEDSSLGEALVDSGWVPAGDLSLGASLLAINPDSDPTSHIPRFWITPEFGYAWAGRASAALSPKTDADDPRQFGTLSMTGVALRGLFFRANITTTF
jgi:hypothetical protein